jgi:hypothetical protein
MATGEAPESALKTSSVATGSIEKKRTPETVACLPLTKRSPGASAPGLLASERWLNENQPYCKWRVANVAPLLAHRKKGADRSRRPLEP